MKLISILLIAFFSVQYFAVTAQQGFVIDHRHTDIHLIPDNWIDSAKQKLKIRYFRRSHGSHVDRGGMTALMNYSSDYAQKYAFGATGRTGELFLSNKWHSVDFEPDTWYSITRAFLDDPANSDINVVMWAWSSKFYISNVQAYLDTMEVFIADYGPNGNKIKDGTRTVPVTFIFQTACSQKSLDANQTVYEQNEQIRRHCFDKNRILFDFNDLECYDPDGNYYGDGNPDGSYTDVRMLNDDLAYKSDSTDVSIYGGRGNWGIEWMNRNPDAELTKLAADNICDVCEHSMGTHEGETKDNSRLHCVLKGRAAWWMWAVLAGWDEGMTPTSIEKKSTDINSGDLKNYPNPFNGATIIAYKLVNNAHVKLEIWNTQGQLVKSLVDKNQTKGKYEVPVLLDKGGMYFYTLTVDDHRITKKMIKID
ncbi:MAG: T9SS type A sorting domain-containing protein [Bacteroidales bacterium]|nr:T9SS type A sorting domain-containing protein [Bacteroidales bacterium]